MKIRELLQLTVINFIKIVQFMVLVQGLSLWEEQNIGYIEKMHENILNSYIPEHITVYIYIEVEGVY